MFCTIFFNKFALIFISILIVIVDLPYTKALKYYTEKPSYLTTCKIFEPEFTKCSTSSIQKLMTQVMKTGIPEVIEEFGSMDPLKMENILFKQDNNEVATIRANLTQLIVTGLSDMIIKESRVSKKDFNWRTKVFIPNMRLAGIYKMSGRILLIPLNGAGDFFIEIENLDILMRAKTVLYEKGGFTFYNVTKINVDLNMTRVKTNFENLFNGHSKDVERSTNEFFNENWRDFLEALRPLITETVESILHRILYKVFDLLPANFLVEDIPTSVQLYGNKAIQSTM